MISRLKQILNQNTVVFPFVERLETVFSSMDDQYQTVSSQYGFNCTGCDDNCCFTLFYHHTLLECLYLKAGYSKLDPDDKITIMQNAHQFNDRQQQVLTGQPQISSQICPLNRHNLCGLYAYRPMICRLHGIPYELHTPGKKMIQGGGCGHFDQQCRGQPYRPFNRTPLYAAMAKLESEIRQALLFNDKIKLTVAQIVLLFD
jgi:Fe-S-cluster containining protein